MTTGVEANLAILAALASLGFGWILAVLGLVSARRMESAKLAWVAAGFFLLGLQGGLFAFRVVQDTENAADVLWPALVGLAALAALYFAIYRRE